MMRTLILFIVLVLGIGNFVAAQTFENFEVEPFKWGWALRPKFDSSPCSGVNGMHGDPDEVIFEIIKECVQTFPPDIKKELKQREVWVNFYFNSQGKVFYVYFHIRKKGEWPNLTDEQWMEIYRIVRELKMDLSQFELANNFEWGFGGTYPMSKYLQDAEESIKNLSCDLFSS